MARSYISRVAYKIASRWLVWFPPRFPFEIDILILHEWTFILLIITLICYGFHPYISTDFSEPWIEKIRQDGMDSQKYFMKSKKPIHLFFWVTIQTGFINILLNINCVLHKFSSSLFGRLQLVRNDNNISYFWHIPPVT